MSSNTTAQTPSNVTPTTTQTPVPFYLSYHIINKEFNDSLTDRSSAYFQQLNETIGQMYRSIYGCESCVLKEEYQGYNITRFRPGSVAADTELFFMTRQTPEQLAQTATDTFNNASTTERQGLELNSTQGSSEPISGTTTPEPTPASPETTTRGPSTASTTEGSHATTTSSRTTAPPPSSVTSTTAQNPVPFYLAYHIKNREFDNTLLDPTTLYYKQMNETIGKMYENIYHCPGCVHRDEYRGYSILKFGPGSVATWTVLFFNTTEPPAQLAEALRQIFESSSPAQREQLILISIQGGSTPIPIPEPPTPVPGWGIALLVLVCILLLLAIIAYLIVIIYRCRRSHRGHLDMLNSQDSYHPMSEYPTYHTHGRYAAPFTKPNPYDKQPTNGTSPFSYTNPAMANDNL
ncbi:PREDICTED: mucin-1 [Gekko japonicus]|uniref:Mucin-1 n=1 Tax=Gekko japonicus TaxID=146911 RepID=A0ABM1KLM2_GEKJA|nr:PREDICTED: mucin-1 [Gekko japonicus]